MHVIREFFLREGGNKGDLFRGENEANALAVALWKLLHLDRHT